MFLGLRGPSTVRWVSLRIGFAFGAATVAAAIARSCDYSYDAFDVIRRLTSRPRRVGSCRVMSGHAGSRQVTPGRLRSEGRVVEPDVSSGEQKTDICVYVFLPRFLFPACPLSPPSLVPVPCPPSLVPAVYLSPLSRGTHTLTHTHTHTSTLKQ